MKPDIDPRKILAAGLTAAVEASDQSREAIAEEARLTRAYLGKLMKGRANPSAEALFRLSEALGCRISEIYARGEARVLDDTLDPEYEEILGQMTGLVGRIRRIRAAAVASKARSRAGTR